MNQVNIQMTTKRLLKISVSGFNDCASEGTVAFGVSSAAGAAVAELAPLSGAFMLLAIFGKGVIANWRGPNF